MAKRKNTTVRIDASEVQGEGAFLSLRYYTWAERRELQARMQALPDFKADPVAWRVALMPVLEAEVHARVVEWNFTDGEGQPIQAGDIDALIDGEHNFVFGKVQELIMQSLGVDEAAKN